MYGIVVGLIALFSVMGNDITSYKFVHPVPQYMGEMPVISAEKDVFDQTYGWLTEIEIEVVGTSDMCITDGEIEVYDSLKLVSIIYYFSPCNNPGAFIERIVGTLDTDVTGVYALSIEFVKGNTLFYTDTFYFYYGVIPRLFVPLMDGE